MQNHHSKPNWTRRKLIGKGSFGVVNLAVNNNNDGSPFAVKSVEKNSNSNNVLRSLENEIRVLKSLSSPYVVTYLGDDITCEYSTTYRNLHMEYMPNGTLADMAKHGGTIGYTNLRNYIRCITSALSYIHSKNIVHCDVKGANVLIGNDSCTAKLADFGSAIESRNGIRGSLLWMAPEVIRGDYIGPESDVWSLGCTIIEILTGKPAWQNRGGETIRQIGYSNDVPEIPPRVPEDVHDFLNKCLKRDISERWSCNQLLHHPFLLSCSSLSQALIRVNDCEPSPRCVFDWSESTCSDQSAYDVYQFDVMRCDAKQRIGKLASDSGVVWESEGWEVVRHVTFSTSMSGNGRVNWEDVECSASYDYDFECTTSNARDTRVGGVYRALMYTHITLY
ncbi:hypothetical protein QVD17_02822 [Tagetes erecta]|uniref:Protein kinase domain-containing protein n=1 Tax=Tagetes erecta TaxID=13708 RepID=A0AAD8LEM3_TARER|nr:hypothetical protein QVD17_02822 [Tagetes erecta]